MTTTRDQRGEQNPLQTDLGTTTIQDAVVTNIAGVAAQEIEGANMSSGGTRLPGDPSSTMGNLLGSVTGAGSRGISVDVGESQTAIDLSMNVRYGIPIAQVTQAVRQNVIRRVESLTGLEVSEVNITVNDVTFEQ